MFIKIDILIIPKTCDKWNIVTYYKIINTTIVVVNSNRMEN